MKYKIEKNTVQETLILPLYSRKLCTELYPNLYRDESAVHLIDQIDYDFSEAEKNSRSLMQRFGALEVAMRQNDLAFAGTVSFLGVWVVSFCCFFISIHHSTLSICHIEFILCSSDSHITKSLSLCRTHLQPQS